MLQIFIVVSSQQSNARQITRRGEERRDKGRSSHQKKREKAQGEEKRGETGPAQ